MQVKSLGGGQFSESRGLVDSLAVDKARGLAVEDGGGVVGFRLSEEGAGESEAPARSFLPFYMSVQLGRFAYGTVPVAVFAPSLPPIGRPDGSAKPSTNSHSGAEAMGLKRLPVDLRRTVSRTLAANGYVVTRGYSHPSHVTIDFEKTDLFGCRLAYLLAVTDEARLAVEETAELRRRSVADRRLLVVLSQVGGDGQLSFEEFIERLGGEVPRWRALTEEYHAALHKAARNRLPKGQVGPAWRLLEELAGDGLEFALGRRARRMGGRSSGSRVPDILIVSPDERLYLLDTKAAASPFDASWPNLRALGEYVDQQKERQRGSFHLDGALVISSRFVQCETSLTELALEFSGQHGVMLSFLTAETISEIVRSIKDNVDIRNALQWRKVFQGGAVRIASFERELRRARGQRVER